MYACTNAKVYKYIKIIHIIYELFLTELKSPADRNSGCLGNDGSGQEQLGLSVQPAAPTVLPDARHRGGEQHTGEIMPVERRHKNTTTKTRVAS